MEKHSGPVQLRIQQKLGLEFCPTYLQVVNESYKHSVPPGSESHFKVVIVSDAFEGKSPIQRHRSINTLLGEELSSSVHALSIQAKTPDQWEKSGHSSTNTPPCLGGSKADKR
ncbi:unnamed protein product [Clavelina lepadiformis]|uniref:Uncharacterized protein n=1 Tax=Clavelina lepadiformis TaxID=159417 RepID=A0ABP0GKJ1_CLALP